MNSHNRLTKLSFTEARVKGMFDHKSHPNPDAAIGRSAQRIDGRQSAELRRDAALRRVARLRTGLIAGTAGLTAGFAALVAATAPGKTYHAASSVDARVTASSVPASQLPPLATARELGLRAGRAPNAVRSTKAPSPSASGSAASNAAPATAPASAPATAPASAPATATAPAAVPAPVPVPAPAPVAPVSSGGS
jgi:hypothetical protein